MRGETADFAAGSGGITRGQRKPWNEADIFALTIVENIFGGLIENAVTILHADDGDDGTGVLDLGDADFGKADMFYFPLGLEILESVELIFGGKFVVNAVQLEKIDAFEAEAAETAFAGGAQVLGTTVGDPFVGAGAVEAGFSGNQQIFGVRIQSFGDDFFADMRAVGIGGVDEINSQVDGAAKNLNGFGTIFGFAPNALSSKAHGSVTEAVDGDITANAEFARLRGG